MKISKAIAAAAFSAFLAHGTLAAEISVTITGVASTEGTVRAALHDGAEGFTGNRKPVQGALALAAEGSVTLVFQNVEPGRYAVTAFHDVDGNEALSTNLLGMPNEPFGFSRDARGLFGPPSFDDAAFEVGANGVEITFKVGN